MSRANPFERLGRMARERGLRGVWFAALAECGYRRMLIREFVLANAIPDAAPGIPVTFEPLREAQLDEYHAFRAPQDRHATLRHMDEGHRCVIGRHNGAIVCACWVATGRAWSAYLSAPIALSPDEVYIYDVFTRPDVRRQGVAEALRVEVCRLYRAQGVRRVVSYVIPEAPNVMSRTLAFRSIGRIGYIRIGPLRHDFRHIFSGAIAPGAAPPEPGATAGGRVA